jgi:hypothetical protein
MKLSLYFSSNQLRLLIGSADSKRATIEEFKEFALPKAAMINGVIIDKDAMSRFLKAVTKQYGPFQQETTLVIESNNIRSKIMTLPAVRESQLASFVQQDFVEISEGSDDVFDFTVLEPNQDGNGLDVLGIAASRVLLQNYADIIERAGFKLKRIDVSSNVLAKLSRFIPQLHQSNVVLALIDEDALTLTLFRRGIYRIAQRYRMTKPSGSDERILEGMESLSSMVQFQQAHHREINIDAVYLIGEPPARMPVILEHARFLKIPVHSLKFDDQLRFIGRANFDRGHFLTSRFLLNLGALIHR